MESFFLFLDLFDLFFLVPTLHPCNLKWLTRVSLLLLLLVCLCVVSFVRPLSLYYRKDPTLHISALPH